MDFYFCQSEAMEKVMFVGQSTFLGKV